MRSEQRKSGLLFTILIHHRSHPTCLADGLLFSKQHTNMYKSSSIFALLFLLTTAAVGQSHSLEFSSYKAPNKVSFEYVVLTPANYDKNKAYPALLAFSAGDQDRKAVTWSAQHMWGPDNQRDWIIVLPTIPKQSWHTHPSHHALEAFLDDIKKQYNVKDNTFHLTGFGDGSRAAITYANMSNTYFSSFTVTNPTPWNRWEDRDLKRLTQRNKNMPIRILVGEKDKAAYKAAQRVEQILSPGGIHVELVVLHGEDEKLESLKGGNILTEVARTAGH